MTTLHINYILANMAGYKFNIVKIGEHVYDDLAYYNKNNFPDMEITRPNTGTDLSLLHNKCLMSINGYIYPTVYTDSRLYVPNATKSMLRTRDNSVGILSFNKLSSPLSKYSITTNMITTEEQMTMFEKTIITFDRDINYPILIMGGYMVFENPEFFYRLSSNSFALRLDRLNYVEKLYETYRYRDIFGELEVPVSPNNPSMVDGDLVRSNDTIIKYLTCFNSFMVDMPVTNFNVGRIYLDHSNVPGNFRTDIEPTLPIIVGYGKLGEYTKRKNSELKYTAYIADAYYNNHLFSNLSTDEIKVYNDHRLPGSTYRLAQAFFLDMSTNI